MGVRYQVEYLEWLAVPGICASLAERTLGLLIQGYYDGTLFQLTKRHQQRQRRRKGPDERTIITGQVLPEPGEGTYQLLMLMSTPAACAAVAASHKHESITCRRLRHTSHQQARSSSLRMQDIVPC